MTSKILHALAALALITSTASASILKTEAGTKTIESVTLAKSGTVTLNNQDIKVDVVGAGLRKKKVTIFKVSVYVLEVLSSDASKFIRTEKDALNSLDQGRTLALRLNFVRTVEAEKVQISFRDALSVNNVKLDSPEILAFLDAVNAGGAAEDGSSLVIVTQKNADGTETVVYENTKGQTKTVNGPAGFSKSVLSIWLGVPADAQIADLKEEVIKGL